MASRQPFTWFGLPSPALWPRLAFVWSQWEGLSGEIKEIIQAVWHGSSLPERDLAGFSGFSPLAADLIMNRPQAPDTICDPFASRLITPSDVASGPSQAVLPAWDRDVVERRIQVHAQVLVDGLSVRPSRMALLSPVCRAACLRTARSSPSLEDRLFDMTRFGWCVDATQRLGCGTSGLDAFAGNGTFGAAVH